MRSDLAIITVRGPDFHPNQRLLQAARSGGVRAELLNPYDCVPAIETGVLSLSGRGLPPFVLPRQGADLGAFCLDMLRQMELAGARVINRPRAVALCSRKQSGLQVLAAEGIPVVGTRLVAGEPGFRAALESLGGYPLVAKKPSGSQGNGVALIRNEEQAGLLLAHWLKRRQGILLQEFLPPEGRRDLRLLMVGGNCAGAMELKPKPGDFRANYHQGRDASPLEPGPELVALAKQACRALDLEIAGIDLMIRPDGRALVCEANYAPGFAGLENATGLDIAGKMMDYVRVVINEKGS